ncbi:anaphase-promoting complex, subunit 10-domain-containing protein [Fusarium solani]|uniref:Anaphase-promoting complex, subunit 10-domain-containing protein n=1 Tax=Fusarium solani TaxID=169388 RepID=A0A9P9K4R5_FUSSL|nr:anaphase-promoting complex, subunit 10-domain-containing protein [Fusarium solani]KAH7249312.1 anaphase-promoting complex, subunit 10-domain-containing protein [Fusarium solani]
MDITRGSRRARHVAAAHTTPNAAAASSPQGPGGTIPNTSSPAGTPSGPARLPPAQGASPAAALVTPDAPAALHRTPDQPPDQRRRRAPPPNPFRLYRKSAIHPQTCPLSAAVPPTFGTLPSRTRSPSSELPSKNFLSSATVASTAKAGAQTSLSTPQARRIFRPSLRRPKQLQQAIDEVEMEINDMLAAQPADHPRLSMPLLDSDDSGSEPDLSVLGMARPGTTAAPQIPSPYNNRGAEQVDDEEEEIDDNEAMSPEQYEAETTSIEEEDEPAEDEDVEEVAHLIDPATAGLKEISNLARFTVSSHKPGNGVEELKSDDLKMYWQSDGPQPHKLTMYFTRRVDIRDIRFYVDYNEDESYTPTKVVFKAGTGENNLIEFATMALDNPVGWQQVPVAGAGGDPDGNTLVAWVLQMQILENHQNGKDTHLRGIKIYSFDNESALAPGRDGNPVSDAVGLVDGAIRRAEGDVGRVRVSSVQRDPAQYEPGAGGLSIPDFMRDPEIR